ncbi:toxin-antitoxin system YwqK family antitoxin [Arcticibacterium luteifluviistationis]|uniref:Toxin-antitoxin system YwqK family antitoxin n=1 Tax=Arcticibacterium luteifluviistationis TaxID=1784714 RepID=A0A2Z4GFV4_9BACT|nr:toxin-antitoxin system YwqK family antitoxin [Arcticibacterium luteifluviistationis]AWW00270.1 hypothetical protein DJ013_19670 [Arcticibacterium luteifluviistationis]
MRYFFLSAVVLLLYACKTEIPDSYILKSKATSANNILYLNQEKYSGYVYELNPTTGDTLLIEGYLNGLQEGTSKKWYDNKSLMEIRHYAKGAKNGQQVAFFENGNKRFEYTAKNDAYEGEMKEWNNTGLLIHLANYTNGQEEGTQKLWYDNGKIRANYVIVDGKRFGLLGTKNCVNVSDSVFISK